MENLICMATFTRARVGDTGIHTNKTILVVFELPGLGPA